MKTVDDITTSIYRYIKTTELFSSINGRLINGKDREDSSTTEDITIKVLANELGQRQESYVNVNVYVPDSYRNGRYFKDDERVPLLERVAIDSLEVFHMDDARVTIVSQTTMPSASGKEHIINNRLLYQIINE